MATKKKSSEKKTSTKKKAPIKKKASDTKVKASIKKPQLSPKKKSKSKTKKIVKKTTKKKAVPNKMALKKIASKKVRSEKTKKSPKKKAIKIIKKTIVKKKTTLKKTKKKSSRVLPELSIVIPIYNEEKIVADSIRELVGKLEKEKLFNKSYEIILSENGSTDSTIRIVEKLMQDYPQVRLIRVGEPNYGLALRKGILMARADLVICDEIDLCDVDFYVRALDQIENHNYDLVVGSKALDSSRDHRPLFRKAATFTLNSMLRVFLGFHGTDTHGLKALRKSRLLKVVDRCVVEKDLFASEFVIRTERMGFRSKEIPVTIAEKRPPSINLTKRVPGVLKNLGQLFWVIRVKHR